MLFELGKTYIVDATEKGIIPLMEFDRDRWFDKDHDDLDFLTDEEKVTLINDVLNKIIAEVESIPRYGTNNGKDLWLRIPEEIKKDVLTIIDKYKHKVESEE